LQESGFRATLDFDEGMGVPLNGIEVEFPFAEFKLITSAQGALIGF